MSTAALKSDSTGFPPGKSRDVRRDLLSDESGATMVIGVFMAAMLVGFLYYLHGTANMILHRDHLQDACRPFDIEIRLRDPSTHLSAYSAATAECKPYRLRLGGRNQPGALRKLSQVMSLRSIDITGMHALRTAEGSGFEMVLRLAAAVRVVLVVV